MGLSLSLTSGFGTFFVNGINLLPLPPAIIKIGVSFLIFGIDNIAPFIFLFLIIGIPFNVKSLTFFSKISIFDFNSNSLQIIGFLLVILIIFFLSSDWLK